MSSMSRGPLHTCGELSATGDAATCQARAATQGHLRPIILSCGLAWAMRARTFAASGRGVLRTENARHSGFWQCLEHGQSMSSGAMPVTYRQQSRSDSAQLMREIPLDKAQDKATGS